MLPMKPGTWLARKGEVREREAKQMGGREAS